jgi:predicted HicB family RNase H-like nuclease
MVKKVISTDTEDQDNSKKERNVKRINCEFSPDVYEQIKITAWLKDVSMNQFINEAVKEYLDKHVSEDVEAIKKLARKMMK